ncbi:MAG: sulfatase-like hydrolase/transferase [Candidatus Acidiferrales bacterium]
MFVNLKTSADDRLHRSAKVEQAAANSRNWVSAARFVLPWFVAAILCFLAKAYLLENQSGFRIIAHYLGRAGRGAHSGLSLLEKLTFFRSEILFELLLVPLLLLLLFQNLHRFARALLVALLTLGVSLVLYIQFRAVEETGRFVPFELLMLALSWGWHDPGANKAYLLTKEFYLFLGCLVCQGIFLWWASRNCVSVNSSSERRWKTAARCYLGTASVLAALSWIPLLPASPYHRNILWRSVRSFWRDGPSENREFEGLPAPELERIYGELTHAPASARDPLFFAKEKGANLIVIVLETTPARFLPADDSLDEFPNLRRLQAHSIVAENQFTTYAYTNRALFSLFSSWYPSDSIKTFDEQFAGLHFPGMIQSLAGAGYATALFAPSSWEGQQDQEMFRSLGFQKIEIPDWQQVKPQIPNGSSPNWKTYRIAQDLAALALMKQAVAGWLTNSRPFAAAFVPQVGHLPWPDAAPENQNSGLVWRGRAILAMQDAWLGELLDLLEERRQLNHTLIIVTGDHGIRTRREDPAFSGGATDEYSFHVPFRLYAPNAVQKTLPISWLTSHIDVAPSVLDLLGIEAGRGREQGSPLWNPEIAGRTTFFFGRQTFGADAFFSKGRYFMWSEMSGVSSAGNEPHFHLEDIVPRDSPEDREIPRTISRMVELQKAWIARMGGEAERTR